MFPSASLFAEIHCPFLGWGRCERPYCLYKHAKEENTDGSTGAVCPAAVTGHSSHDAVGGAFTNQKDSDTCLLELERINKQIEAVKSEVEKEQKRLSRYQLEQAESTVCSEKDPLSRSIVSKDQNGNQVKCKKTADAVAYSLGRKYVVDRTRPKTDLEYDPCSNFSADIRSSVSVEKVRSSNKAEKEHDHGDTGTTRCVSPDLAQPSSLNLEDTDEEGMLVIDIPTLEYDRQLNKHQEQTLMVNEDVALVAANGGEIGGEKNSAKSPNILKITGNYSGVVPEITDKTMNCFNEELASSKSCLVIDIEQQENDRSKPKYSGVKREKLSSPVLVSGGTEPLVQCMIASEVPKSSEIIVIDSPPVANKPQLHTDVKQSLAIGKHDKFDEEISQPLLTETERSQEHHGSTKQTLMGAPESSQFFCLEKPMSVNSVNVDCYEERPQNIQNVLDDISMCLDNLRSESEKIACFQDVESLFQDSVPSAVASQTVKTCVQNVNAEKLEFEVQQSMGPKPDIMSAAQSSHAQQEKMIFKEYIPTMNSVSGPGPNPMTFVETWPAASKILPETVVQNVPMHISGIGPPAQSSNLLNTATTSVSWSQDLLLQKPAASVNSYVTYESGTSSQTATPALIESVKDKSWEKGSSSSEELNYSDLDLSETDPMEECYNIFMEANKTEVPTVQGDMPEELPKIPEAEVPVNPPPAQKKRVAHVAKFEQVTKTKAQVIVPLREGGSQLALPNRSQQCQKRATVLTSAVKGCQSFIAANAPKRVLTPATVYPSNALNSCVNILPVGTTLRLGSNLHLIVPDGNCALPLTLIPVTRPTHQPVQSPQSAQPANYTPAKAIPTKRKAKVRTEVGVKVPHDVRQRYVNLFVEEFLKTSATVQEAFEKALAEEKTVFDRSINKLKYLSIAVNALKRLKNQNTAPAKFSSEGDAHASRGNVPLNTQALLGNGDATLYDQLKEHVLTETLLRENNYPRRHPDQVGVAIQYGETKKVISDAFRRICCRCGTTFSVSQTGRHTRKEECNYHYGKVIENRVPGGVETRYSCCENAVGSPGCQVFKLHVHDAVGLQGFMSTNPQLQPGCPGIYAIDTAMCFTTQGLELVRITVVNSSLQVVYDTFVKPINEVIDYNTRFSGVSEEDVKGSSSSLGDVQAVLLSFISENTILIGHGLENDLCALKLFHSMVVDTSVAFPHRLGPPHKRDLNSLTADYLRRIIQESVADHDTRGDAVACMELMLWKVKEDSKVKRW